MARKIDDFGEKINGARKDLMAIRKGDIKITDDLLNGWSDDERNEYIVKDVVWKKPDYKQLLEEGSYGRDTLFFIKQIRDALPAKPVRKSEEYQRGYVNFISDVRDYVMELKSTSEVKNFCDNMQEKYLVKSGYHRYSPSPETYGCFSNKLFQVMQQSPSTIHDKADSKEFLYSADEKLMKKHIMLIASPQEYDKVETANYFNDDYIRLKMYHKPSPDRFAGSFLNCVVRVPEGVNKSDFMDKFNTNCFDCEVDKWFVVGKNNQLLYSGLDTKEEAEKLALEYANKKAEAEKDRKAASLNPDDNYASKKLTKLLPPQLEHIQRTGTPHREKDVNIVEQDILDSFSLRGGQFGEYLNQKDRQASLNMAFDAFRDLAVALDIPYEDVSLKREKQDVNSRLAMAFGARGHSKALAHYEPVENVINLTKMKGAGSLAHEWGHALDAMVKKELNLEAMYTAKKSQKYLATHCYQKDNPFNEVVKAMQTKTDEYGEQVSTDYYRESKKTDQNYASTDNGYWRSNCEMFARAFACYVRDKLEEKGIRSDYLCGHSEGTVYPTGEERKAINASIDNLITDLKERGLLRHQEHDIEAEMFKALAPPVFTHDDNSYNIEDFGEQMSLFDLFDENDLLPKDEAEKAVADAPLPAPEDKFDLTKQDFTLVFDRVVSTEMETALRFEVEGMNMDDLTDGQINSLIERAGVQKWGEEQAEKAFYDTDKQFLIDIGENDKGIRFVEGVLAMNYNNPEFSTVEFSVQLSPQETQLVKTKAEAEIGMTIDERMQAVKEAQLTFMDMDDKDMTD